MTDYQAQYKMLKKKMDVLDKSILTGVPKEIQRSDLAYQIRVLREKAKDEGTPLLEPCPFCGSVDVQHSFVKLGQFVFCNDCLTRGPLEDVESEAIAKWNQRSI